MKQTLCIVAAILFTTAALLGQAAEKVDTILETEKTTFGQAAYLIQTALNDNSDKLDFETAFEHYKSEHYKLQEVLPQKGIFMIFSDTVDWQFHS